MRVRYTPRASGDLAAILRYLNERSPQGLRNVKRAIDNTERLIGQYRKAGAYPRKQGRACFPRAVPIPHLLDYRGRRGLDRSRPRWTAQAVARRLIGRKAEALRGTVKDCSAGRTCLRSACAIPSSSSARLLRRHPVVEGTRNDSPFR